jgi:hypothetical protein
MIRSELTNLKGQMAKRESQSPPPPTGLANKRLPAA